jgi:SAM-dependent methyltransferase
MTDCPEYGAFAEFYDHVVPYRNREDVGFFVSLARETGGPVLEVGCGTGRVLVPTARAGIDIDGIDRSPPMLAICRQTLAREPDAVRGRVRLYEQDMRTMRVDRKYALVTSPFRAFQHMLTVDDQLAALSAMHRHLEPGGRLVLDVFNPSLPMLTDPNILTQPVAEPEFTMPDGRRVVRSYQIMGRDHLDQVQEIVFLLKIVHPDGREEDREDRFRLRHLFRFEGEHLLERSGFRVDAVYADYDRSPYGSKYPGELIYLATRRL